MPRKAARPPDLTTQHGRLRWAREARGYPSARVAAVMLRVNENTYKSHEYGVRRKDALPLEDAKVYAKKLNVDLAWLMTGEGSPFPEDRREKPKAEASAHKRRVA